MTRKATTKKPSKKLAKILETQTWADYAVDTLIPKHIVHRFDDRAGNRFYFFLNGEEVVIAVGVTTAFGAVSTERDAIEKWKEKHINWKHLLNASSDYGTSLHIQFKNICLKSHVDKALLDSMRKIAIDNDQSQDMPAKDILSLLKFKEDFEIVPLLIEAQLAYQDIDTGEWLALTIDILAKIIKTEVVKETVQEGFYMRGERKGEPKMVEKRTEVKKERIMVGDLKSNFFEKENKNFYEPHLMQLITGAKAVKQNFGITVDGAFNLSPSAWRTSPSYTYFEHDINDNVLKTWDAYWRLIVAKGINRPRGRFLVTDTFKDSADYKLVSYEEYATNALKIEKL